MQQCATPGFLGLNSISTRSQCAVGNGRLLKIATRKQSSCTSDENLKKKKRRVRLYLGLSISHDRAYIRRDAIP